MYEVKTETCEMKPQTALGQNYIGTIGTPLPPANNGLCPYCGRCPHCGQPTPQFQPYPYYPNVTPTWGLSGLQGQTTGIAANVPNGTICINSAANKSGELQ